jgi:hypothetical protein
VSLFGVRPAVRNRQWRSQTDYARWQRNRWRRAINRLAVRQLMPEMSTLDPQGQLVAEIVDLIARARPLKWGSEDLAQLNWRGGPNCSVFPDPVESFPDERI